MALGMTWKMADPGEEEVDDPTHPVTVNTRHALWPDRWPVIALQECVDKVEAAPAEQQPQVKYDLACQICPEAGRCLNAKAKEVGSLVYARENLTLPQSAESTLFPRSLFRPMLNPNLECQRFYQKPAGREADTAIVQAWDLAWSERSGGDYLVCVTASVDVNTGARTLVDIQRWQRLTFTEQCELIEQKWRDHNAELVVIESDSAQKIWAQYLKETSPVPVMPHRAGNEKTNLRAGVPSLLIEFQNAKWEIPFKRGGRNHAEVENMLTEFGSIGWDSQGRLNATSGHDDTVMAFWHMEHAIRRMLLGGPSRQTHSVVPGVHG